MGKVIEEYRYEGKKLVVLSLHVDYWNRLGWKDPFSQPVFSAGQNEYATQMNADNVYTPQVVINGEWEAVGSNEILVKKYIANALGNANTTRLVLSDVKQNDQKLEVAFTTEKTNAASIIHFAIVENKATTKIKAGENGGVTLNNYNIVRSWKTMKISGDGEQDVALDLPAGYNASQFSVIGFVEEKAGGKIVAVDTR